ncbi:MAG: pilus assembly protein [Rhodospirillales bacterium]|nr:pilus assembly protein [Rhodospirillales bacterium]MBO6788732.1 pilus assembly protein [Rhodospirillales bacterium]
MMRLLALFRKNEKGEALIAFAFIMPILLAISFAGLDFTLAAFDYHRASEATRAGARLAAAIGPVFDKADFTAGSKIECVGTGSGVSCSGKAAKTPDRFSAIVAEMQQVFPPMQASNLRVVYEDAGLGDPTTPGGAMPVVTVRLENLTRKYLLLSAIPGVPDEITYKPFVTNQVSTGLGAF